MARKKTEIDHITLKTLSTSRFNGEYFKNWKGNDRSYEPVIQRLIKINQPYFDFLGITAHLDSDKYNVYLDLTASQFIGSAPMLRPDSGIDAGVFSVTGRYGEHPEELIDLLKHTIRPEYNFNWQLSTSPFIDPPVFMECCAYLDLYLRLLSKPWQKFKNEALKSTEPTSSTQWREYAIRTARDPMQNNVFINKRNILTTDHEEHHYLNYVCQLAINTLLQPTVPCTVSAQYAERIALLQTKLRGRKLAVPGNITPHNSDPAIVKELKRLAQIILKDQSGAQYAWRIDYSEFFERYVQYLFSQAAAQRQMTTIENKHHPVAGSRPAWRIAYLEPDQIITDNRGESIIVDAKYKKHMYEWNSTDPNLHDTFRSDLHQILAYMTIVPKAKKGILVYPANTFRYKIMHIGISAETEVILVGVPMVRDLVEDTIDKIAKILSTN